MIINDFRTNEEISCYAKIIDCFTESKNDFIKKENCKNKSLIKMMEILKKRNDKQLVRNALIIILSLFEGDDQPADFFSKRGKELHALNDQAEKEKIILELKKEFLS